MIGPGKLVTHRIVRRFEGWSGRRGARRCAILGICAALGLTLGVAVLLAGSAPSAPSFARARSYATGRGPLSIAIGDLNGDGKPDLATANPKTDTSTDTVSVLLNRGDGSFQGKRNYRAGRVPFAVAIGDLNGDGKEDLAVANFGGNTVSVFVNKGDGSFQAKRDYAAGEYPSSVAIGDVSGDGNPDLVIANRGGTVSVLLGRGDGSFAARRAYRTGGLTSSVAIGDVNGDGAPDLATDDGSVLLNRGDGSFAARPDYGVDGFWVGIGDVNGDGKPDLMAANLVDPRPGRHSYTFILTISVRLNRGDGTFLARRDSRGGRYPNTQSYSGSSGALGNLNGDGRPDLAIACCGKPVVAVLTNNGDGRFLPKLEYRTGRPYRPPEDPSIVLPDQASAVSIGDLDGDGKLDLGVANDGSGTVSVLINAPGLCTVQDVRGMTLATARRTVARGNCRVGKVRRAYSKTVRRGRVISQKPNFGAVLRGGSKVNLVISRGRRHS